MAIYSIVGPNICQVSVDGSLCVVVAHVCDYVYKVVVHVMNREHACDYVFEVVVYVINLEHVCDYVYKVVVGCYPRL